MEKTPTEGLLKIGELARAAGVSVSTAKYYVKEGLIRPECKTGRNMAYYSPDNINRIGFIKTLQRERYYPLSVIKQLLESSVPDMHELELLDAIHKVHYTVSGDDILLADAVRATRLSTQQIAELAEVGLVSPVRDGRRQLFSDSDMHVMKLIRRRMDAGIPFEQSKKAFLIYSQTLGEAVKTDVDGFITGALMITGPSSEDGARMIRVSDETLDDFIKLKRTELNRCYGSNRLGELEKLEARLVTAMHTVADELAAVGRREDAALCRKAASGIFENCPEVIRYYWGFTRRSAGDIASSIAQIAKCREYFVSLVPSGGKALVEACAKLCWLTLAPPVLDCAAAASDAELSLRKAAEEELSASANSFSDAISAALKYPESAL